MKIRDIEIKIIQADLTQLDVDAIVNAANNELRMGGGLAGAIKRQGGQEIEDEAVRKGPIAVGEAAVTRAGRLKTRYVIHAATMAMDFKTDEHIIRAACANAFRRAEDIGVVSVAVPALGCGVGKFPPIATAKIISQEILKVARDHKGSLREIVVCLHDEETFKIFERQVFGYLRHVTEDLSWGPYVTTDIIIEISGGIVLIERTNPPFGFALPGGFVDRGESLEFGARREAREETGLELEDLKQFHTYSDPSRDPRFQTVTTVFTAKGVGNPQAGDDAKALRVVPFNELRQYAYAFDHHRIVEDYLISRGL